MYRNTQSKLINSIAHPVSQFSQLLFPLNNIAILYCLILVLYHHPAFYLSQEIRCKPARSRMRNYQNLTSVCSYFTLYYTKSNWHTSCKTNSPARIRGCDYLKAVAPPAREWPHRLLVRVYMCVLNCLTL